MFILKPWYINTLSNFHIAIVMKHCLIFFFLSIVCATWGLLVVNVCEVSLFVFKLQDYHFVVKIFVHKTCNLCFLNSLVRFNHQYYTFVSLKLAEK